MRLNPDCIRDILLSVEDICDANHYFNYSQDSENKFINSYDSNTLYYHFRQADLSGLLYGANFDMAGNFYCTDLSPDGHKFLNDIRLDTNWNKTKNIAKNVGSFSLDAIKTISTGVITNLIQQNLTQQ